MMPSVVLFESRARHAVVPVLPEHVIWKIAVVPLGNVSWTQVCTDAETDPAIKIGPAASVPMAMHAVVPEHVSWVSDVGAAGRVSATHVCVELDWLPANIIGPDALLAIARHAAAEAGHDRRVMAVMPLGRVSVTQVCKVLDGVPARMTAPPEEFEPIARQAPDPEGHVIWLRELSPLGNVSASQATELPTVPARMTGPDVPEPMARQTAALGHLICVSAVTPLGRVLVDHDVGLVGTLVIAAPPPDPYPTPIHRFPQATDSILLTPPSVVDIHVDPERTLAVAAIPVVPSGLDPVGAWPVTRHWKLETFGQLAPSSVADVFGYCTLMNAPSSYWIGVGVVTWFVCTVTLVNVTELADPGGTNAVASPGTGPTLRVYDPAVVLGGTSMNAQPLVSASIVTAEPVTGVNVTGTFVTRPFDPPQGCPPKSLVPGRPAGSPLICTPMKPSTGTLAGG